MNTSASAEAKPGVSIAAPLRTPLFRRIWFASLLSNLGFMVLSVGAAWAMTVLTPNASMVALVQTAMMLPMMLLSLVAGAVADMYDRRKVTIAALCMSLTASAALALCGFSGLITPWLLLGFCFLVGSAMALFSPAWQASVGEQVPREVLAQAVALNSISFNIARSFGPALGGIIVSIGGGSSAFATTAACYLPLIAVMVLWRRTPVPSRLPPERIDRAINAGVRYVIHSPQIRTVLLRTFVMGVAGSSVQALMPLIARDILHGNAKTFGLLLGSLGIGAIGGALAISRIRRHLSEEAIISSAAVLMGATFMVIATSNSVVLTSIALMCTGIGWMVALTLFNVLVQTSAPRWVSGRLLAAFGTAIAGGVAIGSWMWGQVAQNHGVANTMLISAATLAGTVLFAFILRMPAMAEADLEPVLPQDPEVNLAITNRSGPIVIELVYHVSADDAREFYDAMQKMRAIRHRNGGFAWSISRNIRDPEIWVERYQCPTWIDYLRQRSRSTPEEIRAHARARALLKPGTDVEVRRLLERPFGSVRWKENALDV